MTDMPYYDVLFDNVEMQENEIPSLETVAYLEHCCAENNPAIHCH